MKRLGQQIIKKKKKRFLSQAQGMSILYMCVSFSLTQTF